MKGVKFSAPLAPYGAGDTALLPDDVADRLIASREAEPYAFPAHPHAHEAGHAPPPGRAAAATSAESSRREQKLSLRKK